MLPPAVPSPAETSQRGSSAAPGALAKRGRCLWFYSVELFGVFIPLLPHRGPGARQLPTHSCRGARRRSASVPKLRHHGEMPRRIKPAACSKQLSEIPLHALPLSKQRVGEGVISKRAGTEAGCVAGYTRGLRRPLASFMLKGRAEGRSSTGRMRGGLGREPLLPHIPDGHLGAPWGHLRGFWPSTGAHGSGLASFSCVLQWVPRACLSPRHSAALYPGQRDDATH